MGSTGRYRVYPGPDDDALRLLDRERFEVTTVPTGDDDTVADLNPGYLIEATLDTSGVEPHLRDASVVRPTLYDFADGAEPMFEVAEDLWADAQMAGEGMASGVTKNTDNEVNGACTSSPRTPSAAGSRSSTAANGRSNRSWTGSTRPRAPPRGRRSSSGRRTRGSSSW